MAVYVTQPFLCNRKFLLHKKYKCAARGDEFCLTGTARALRVCLQTLFYFNFIGSFFL